jgi:hypothetical protein
VREFKVRSSKCGSSKCGSSKFEVQSAGVQSSKFKVQSAGVQSSFFIAFIAAKNRLKKTSAGFCGRR